MSTTVRQGRWGSVQRKPVSVQPARDVVRIEAAGVIAAQFPTPPDDDMRWHISRARNGHANALHTCYRYARSLRRSGGSLEAALLAPTWLTGKIVGLWSDTPLCERDGDE